MHHERSIARARALRQRPTRGESRLWARLRNRRLGAKFRRQHPIGPFIVDFASVQDRLVVEIDGCSHWIRETNDSIRRRVIERDGWTFLRFTENDTARRPDAVAEAIWVYLERRRGAQR